MLNAEIPLFSLKIKTFDWAHNKLQFSFLALSLVLLVVFGFTALPVIILSYVVLSVINNMFWAKK
jgi:CDP-diacylglycerol--serine O-phosphatidyltransferase